MAGHSPLFVRPEEALAVKVDEKARLREPVCQEELCNLGLDLSMNLNPNSILTHQRPIP